MGDGQEKVQQLKTIQVSRNITALSKLKKKTQKRKQCKTKQGTCHHSLLHATGPGYLDTDSRSFLQKGEAHQGTRPTWASVLYVVKILPRTCWSTMQQDARVNK